MPDPNKPNGATQQLPVPEGDQFLFVRLSKAGEFQILFSDFTSALALRQLAQAYLDGIIAASGMVPATPAANSRIEIPSGMPADLRGRKLS